MLRPFSNIVVSIQENFRLLFLAGSPSELELLREVAKVLKIWSTVIIQVMLNGTYR